MANPLSQVDANSVSTVNLIPTDTSVAMPTAVVNLAGGGRCSCTQEFFDTGAQCSFIHAELAQKLCLPVVDEMNLTISPFDSPVQHPRAIVVKVQLGWRICALPYRQLFTTT